MADFGGDAEAFRLEARTWLEENFPKSLKGNLAAQMAKMTGGATEGADAKLWRERMGDKGWGTPTWPKPYGGGLSRNEARVLQEEMAKIGARNPIGGMGVSMFGPTLIEYGTEEQKRKHMPGIVRGDVWWCQGYSEPGAGSDLASLQTRAEDKGDHYLVNGSKIWTSGAQFADWCYCLVRTDPKAKKHEGISFLMIDMHSPGVEVRPILLINGTSPFCETFFTDVKVPKENQWGPLNGGWTVGKRLLQFERDSISTGLGAGNIGGPGATMTVEDYARKYIGLEDGGRLADADYRRRLIDHKMENKAFQLTVRRAGEEAKSNQGPSAASSIMKYAGAKIAQERTELIIEALGQSGLGWDGEGFDREELASVRSWLRAKANSIEGGSSEINLNVVSKRVLGLPDPKVATGPKTN
jgi:alkylation response protein AidB-like acyl-CoA dehydrogenase